MIRKEPKILSHGNRDVAIVHVGKATVGAALPQPSSYAIYGALAGAALVGGYLIFGAKHHVDTVFALATAGAAVVGGIIGQVAGPDTTA